MTAAAATMNSEFASDFTGQRISAQALEAAQDEWPQHLSKSMGGLGKVIYELSGKAQQAAALALVPSAASLVIPVVGELTMGMTAGVYGATSLVQGFARTNAENRAIEKAGGSPDQKGGKGRILRNAIVEANPFDNN